jgi:adenosylhomocysteinase
MADPLAVAQRLDWAARNLPLTSWALDRLPALDGVRIAATVHIDVKIAVAALGFRQRGAEVFLAAASPHTTRDDVRDHLAERGIASYAWRGMPEADRLAGVRQALNWGPTHTCEMGADISTLAAQERGTGSQGIVAGLEATQTGINRLEGLELGYPLYNWDHVPIKAGLHNRYAVGRSTWITFVNRTQLSLQGRTVLVVGFGPVGQGLADVARALGGDVTIAELDPVRRLTGQHAGWHMGDLDQLLPSADVIVTATGRRHVLTAGHLAQLRAGCILVNAGHADDEIELAALHDRTELIPYVERCTVNGTELYLFAGGAPANITAGFGDSLDSFDVTLAILVSGVGHIVGDGATALPGVHLLPDQVWMPVARRASSAGRPGGRSGDEFR